MAGELTRLPVGEDCWGRILGIRPVSYLVDWSRELPTKKAAAELAAAPLEPYRERVLEGNLEAHYNRFVPLSKEDDFRSLSLLEGSHAGETLVLVGAGPSASGIAERLAPYRDRCKVMACNKALQFVPDADYFYVIEALAKREWWQGIDAAKTKLICPIHASSELADAWAREDTYYGWIKDVRYLDEALDRLPLLCGGCHVGTSALHVAHLLGFSRVLLVGFDFCATDLEINNEARTIKGTFYGDGTNTNQSYIHGHEIWVVSDTTGADVIMTQHLFEHRDAMAISCSIASDAGIDVVNCAGMGMLSLPSSGALEGLLSEPALREVG